MRRALGRPELISRDPRNRLWWLWYLSGEPAKRSGDMIQVTAERDGRVVSVVYVEPSTGN